MFLDPRADRRLHPGQGRPHHEAGHAAAAGADVEHLQDPARVVPGHPRRQGVHDGGRTSGAASRLATKDYYHRAMMVVNIDALADPIIEVLAVAAVAGALLAGAYLVLHKETHLFGVLLRMTRPAAGRRGAAATLHPARRHCRPGAEAVQRLHAHPVRLRRGRPHLRFHRPPAARQATARGRALEAAAIGRRSLPDRRECRISSSSATCASPTSRASRSLRHPSGRPRRRDDRPGRANGCGKTTLLGLLPRFYDPDHGTVLIDGHDLRTVNLRSLRQQIGIVTQETILFDDTIYNNIAYGTRRADAGGGRGGGPQGVRPRLHHRRCRRATRRASASSAAAVRRSEAAAGPGAGDPAQPEHPDPGRVHQRHRRGERGADPPGAEGVQGRPNHVPDHAPSEHIGDRRSHRGAGQGPHRRGRRPRRADGHLPALPAAARGANATAGGVKMRCTAKTPRAPKKSWMRRRTRDSLLLSSWRSWRLGGDLSVFSSIGWPTATCGAATRPAPAWTPRRCWTTAPGACRDCSSGEPELQKPPLYYWLVAAHWHGRGGVDAWAVRLPAAGRRCCASSAWLRSVRRADAPSPA